MPTSAERIAFILANTKPTPQECYNCWRWTTDTKTTFDGLTWCVQCHDLQQAIFLNKRREMAGA
jgi:hypothetical protein